MVKVCPVIVHICNLISILKMLLTAFFCTDMGAGGKKNGGEVVRDRIRRWVKNTYISIS